MAIYVADYLHSSTDNTAEIQAAIDACAPTLDNRDLGDVLVFPTGDLIISDALKIKKSIRVRTDGQCRIKGDLAAASLKAGFYLGDPAWLTDIHAGEIIISMDGLRFDLTNHNNCILSQGVRTPQLNCLSVSGGIYGSVQIQQAWMGGYVRDCRFVGGPGTGLNLLDACNAFQVQGTRFNGYWNGSSGLGAYVTASMGVWFENNDFEYNNRQLVAWSTSTVSCNDLVIRDNWFEGATDETIRIDNSSGGFKGLIMQGNSMWAPTAAARVNFGVSGGVGTIQDSIYTGNTINSPLTIVRGSAAGKYVNVVGP